MKGWLWLLGFGLLVWDVWGRDWDKTSHSADTEAAVTVDDYERYLPNNAPNMDRKVFEERQADIGGSPGTFGSQNCTFGCSGHQAG